MHSTASFPYHSNYSRTHVFVNKDYFTGRYIVFKSNEAAGNDPFLDIAGLDIYVKKKDYSGNIFIGSKILNFLFYRIYHISFLFSFQTDSATDRSFDIKSFQINNVINPSIINDGTETDNHGTIQLAGSRTIKINIQETLIDCFCMTGIIFQLNLCYYTKNYCFFFFFS